MIPSLPKLLGLFAIIWLVWAAFQFFEERKKSRNNSSSDDYGAKSSGGAETAEYTDHTKSVDLKECDVCGAWVIGDTCERETCPF